MLVGSSEIRLNKEKWGVLLFFDAFFLVVWLQIDSISLQIIVTNACFLSVSLFLSL